MSRQHSSTIDNEERKPRIAPASGAVVHTEAPKDKEERKGKDNEERKPRIAPAPRAAVHKETPPATHEEEDEEEEKSSDDEMEADDDNNSGRCPRDDDYVPKCLSDEKVVERKVAILKKAR
jgi:hypothetical protein